MNLKEKVPLRRNKTLFLKKKVAFDVKRVCIRKIREIKTYEIVVEEASFEPIYEYVYEPTNAEIEKTSSNKPNKENMRNLRRTNKI